MGAREDVEEEEEEEAEEEAWDKVEDQTLDTAACKGAKGGKAVTLARIGPP